jgi:hypothetical protein
MSNYQIITKKKNPLLVSGVQMDGKVVIYKFYVVLPNVPLVFLKTKIKNVNRNLKKKRNYKINK